MHYAGSRKSQTDPLASVPLFRAAASIMCLFGQAPASGSPMSFPTHYLPRTELQQRQQ